MGDDNTADDCFQATFLVLVSASGGLRLRGPLGPWLFQVARRICGRARIAARRRAKYEARATAREPAGSLDRDLVELIHAEVGHLAKGLRAAIVLCDLGGLPYQEAADRLGLPHATVRGRLARARARLHQRLVERGIGPEVVWGASAIVPAALVGATARAALVMFGRAAGEVPVPILELVGGGIQSMFMTKFKAIGLSVLTAGVLIAGTVGLSARQPPGPQIPTTPRGGVDHVSNVIDDHDAGDDVAALVRKAQRQQDRGDVAGAQKTLRQIDDGLGRWRTALDENADRAKLRSDLVAQAADFTGRIRVAQPSQPNNVEKRVADLERKLDRLLQELESRRAPGGSPQGGVPGP